MDGSILSSPAARVSSIREEDYVSFEFQISGLLLLAEERLADVAAGQADIGSLLDLLDKVHARPIGTGTLEGGNVCDIDGSLGGQILLGHGATLLVGELLASLLQGLGDLVGNLLGGDNVLAAVDLGQVLAFAALLSCLESVLVRGIVGVIGRKHTLAVANFFSVAMMPPLR